MALAALGALGGAALGGLAVGGGTAMGIGAAIGGGLGLQAMGAQAQERALRRGQATQEQISARAQLFQEQMFAEARPFREAALRGVERAEEAVGTQALDSQLAEEQRLLRSSLAATGNLRSGAGLLGEARAIERAQDRRFARVIRAGTLAQGSAIPLQGQAASLFTPISQIGSDIAQTQIAQGAVRGGLFGSMGETLTGLPMQMALFKSLGVFK